MHTHTDRAAQAPSSTTSSSLEMLLPDNTVRESVQQYYTVLWLWDPLAVRDLWSTSPRLRLWHGTGLLCGSAHGRRDRLCDR
eukprot:1160265-Pelagomonas_calceolata.AAC.2